MTLRCDFRRPEHAERMESPLASGEIAEYANSAEVSVSVQGLCASQQVRVLRAYGEHIDRRLDEGTHHSVRLWRGADPSQGELQVPPKGNLAGRGLHSSQISLRA